MSTRKLIITALLCGLAILLAGGIFLFNVSANRDQLTLQPALAVGEAATVGGRRVVVQRAATESGVLVVDVSITGGAAPGGSAAQGWALNAGGAVVAPVAVPAGRTGCDAATVVAGPVSCVLAYPAPGRSALLEYAYGGAKQRWDVGT